MKFNNTFQEMWQSRISEELICKQEPGNAHHLFAVSVCKNDNIVRHILRTISPPCYTFLGKPGSSIKCRVTEPR